MFADRKNDDDEDLDELHPLREREGEWIHSVDYISNKTGTYVNFNCHDDSIKTFGDLLFCGARVEITCGDWKGNTSTVIGIRNGYLWRHDDGDRGARGFNATNKEELEARYGVRVVGQVEVPNIERFFREHSNSPTQDLGSAAASEAQQNRVRAASVKGEGWAMSILLGYKRVGRFYYAPLKGKDTQLKVIPRKLRIHEYDIGEACFQQFGLRAGAIVMFRKGPRAGQIAKIIGLHQGRIVRQELGDFPREFDYADPITTYDCQVIRQSEPEEEYPERAYFAESVTSFNTDVDYLNDRFGLLHKAIVRHHTGERRGSTGVIIGAFNQDLYEYNFVAGELLPLKGRNSGEVHKEHGLRLVGLHLGPIEPPHEVPFHEMPVNFNCLNGCHQCRASVDDEERATNAVSATATIAVPFDVRFSSCAEFNLGQHGDAVKITSGPRYNMIGRIVGVHDERLWVMYDIDHGAEPVHETEGVVSIARSSEPLLRFETIRSLRTSAVSSFQYPSIFNRHVTLDFSVKACLPFGLFVSQRIVYGAVDEIDPFTNIAEEFEGGFISDGVDGWKLGTVLGVHFHELWILEDSSCLAAPLRGSSREELLMTYRFAVVGYPTVPLVPFLDPLLPQNPEGESHGIHPTHAEVALQTLDNVMPYLLTNGNMLLFSIAPEMFELAGSTLRHGDRLRHMPRIKPRLANDRSHVGATDPNETLSMYIEGNGSREPAQDKWQLFADDIWSTVIGVSDNEVYIVRDNNIQFAVELTEQELVDSKCVLPTDAEYVVAPPLHRPDQDFLECHTSIDVYDPIVADAQRDKTIYEEGALMDSKTVRQAASEVTESQLQELEHAFSLFPPNCVLPVIEWVLSKFSLHLLEQETVDDGLAQLVVVQETLGRTVVIPSFVQWQRREREAMEEKDTKIREMLCLLERNAFRELTFSERNQRNKLVSVFAEESMAHQGVNWAESAMDLKSVASVGLLPSKTQSASASQLNSAATNPSPFVDRWRKMVNEQVLHMDNEFLPATMRSSESKHERRMSIASDASRQSVFAAAFDTSDSALGTPGKPTHAPTPDSPLSTPHDDKRFSAASSFESQFVADKRVLSVQLPSAISRNSSPAEYSLPKRKRSRRSTVHRKAVSNTLISAPHFFDLTARIAWPFRYVFFNGTVAHFDICRSACAQFGFYHGQRLRVTKGDIEGTEVVIIGVYQKRLWRYDAKMEAQPFQGTSERDIRNRHGLELIEAVTEVRGADPFIFHTTTGEFVEFDVQEKAFSPFPGIVFGGRYTVNNVLLKPSLSGNAANGSAIITIIGVRDARVWYALGWCGARPFDGQDIIGEMGLKFLYSAAVTPMHIFPASDRKRALMLSTSASNIVFDITKESCEPFGVFPGQHVQHTSGPLIPQQAIILGVHQGRLFRQLYSDRRTVPYDANASDFQRLHGVAVSKWKPPPLVEVPRESSAWLIQREQSFRYLSVVGEVYTFDTKADSCRMIFGFSHGEKVMFRKPAKQSGKMAVIVGVRQGCLWKVDDGDTVATMFHGCRRYADLQAEHDLQLVGQSTLKEFVG